MLSYLMVKILDTLAPELLFLKAEYNKLHTGRVLTLFMVHICKNRYCGLTKLLSYWSALLTSRQ